MWVRLMRVFLGYGIYDTNMKLKVSLSSAPSVRHTSS